MKLLLDANISWRLVKKVDAHFPETLHVNLTNLPNPASDIEIWSYALQNDFVIVTNDEDFLRLSLAKHFPPKVILLRMGNQSTEFMASILIANKEAIEQLKTSKTIGVLEIY